MIAFRGFSSSKPVMESRTVNAQTHYLRSSVLCVDVLSEKESCGADRVVLHSHERKVSQDKTMIRITTYCNTSTKQQHLSKYVTNIHLSPCTSHKFYSKFYVFSRKNITQIYTLYFIG